MNTTELIKLVKDWCEFRGKSRCDRDTIYLGLLEDYMDDPDYFDYITAEMEKEMEEANND